MPGAIHNAKGGQFAAFARDAEENQALFAKGGKLPMPILAIGGGHFFCAHKKNELEAGGAHVDGGGITKSRHWDMEKKPREAVDVLVPHPPKKRGRAAPPI